MKQVAGIWLPDHEKHMVELFEADPRRIDGKATYQHSKLETALSYCKQFRFALDVGAHVGMWTIELSKRFDLVMAVEPSHENFECLMANTSAENVRCRHCALGDCNVNVSLAATEGSSGDTFIHGAGNVRMWRFDDMGDVGDFDFIKLDCVGYELPALVGMEQTLMRSKPVVCVEQKPGRAVRFGFPETGAVDYLKKLGAVERENMNGVFVLSWG